MRDIDIPRSPRRRAELWEKLRRRAGGRSTAAATLSQRLFRFRHAMDFEAPSGGRVDLHWHALNLCCHSSADQMFWEHSQPPGVPGPSSADCTPAGAPVRHLRARNRLEREPRHPLDCRLDPAAAPVPRPGWSSGRSLSKSGRRPLRASGSSSCSRNSDASVPAEVLTTLSGAAVSALTAAGFARRLGTPSQPAGLAGSAALLARWRRSWEAASPV